MIEIYPKLNSLKQNMRITGLNTGRQFEWRGIVYDDLETLRAIKGLNNCVHIKSGTEMGMTYYRGQPMDYGTCFSTLDRCSSNEEQFISLCRTVAFEFLLDKHPFVQVASDVKFLNDRLCINKTGIAQHYGFHTDYLDLTSNFDIASFFASCRWNEKSKNYEPLGNVEYPGVIFKIHEPTIPPLFMQGCQTDICFEYLGWQPFPRPEQQRASLARLGKKIDFTKNATKYYFKHSISGSRKIWKKFGEGRLLFPEDCAVDLAEKCKNLKEFTKLEIDEAVRRFDKRNITFLLNKDIDKLIHDNNISIVNNSLLEWDIFMETSREFWEEKLNSILDNVRFRLML